MPHLTLAFFGTFQAKLGGKSLTYFRSAKVQGLLIYLALTAPRAYSRDVLATLFWPDDPETVAKRNLRQSLYRLRRLLREDGEKRPFLLTTRSTVQFNSASDFTLDVADFLTALESEDVETAISFYNGDLLSGFTCDSLLFEDWLRQERERYHRLALETLSRLTTESLSQAHFQQAKQLARQQLILEPWREEAHRQLMQALAALGERSAALAQYDTCRAVLAEALDVVPSPETETLAQRIRASALEKHAHAQTTVVSTERRLNIPFVGRTTEYETLLKAYQRVTEQGVQLVTVQGKAGIGKTRLTEQFVTWAAAQGADVLVGRSFETSSKLPYQPLIHLLRQRIDRENAPDDLLSDLWLSQLTRLLPELRDRYPDLPEPTLEENTARQHLFEAITRLIQALAERKPVVLFIDDWHWADSASLDVLHYASVRWSEQTLPVLVVLTLRQGAVSESPALQNWLIKLNHVTTAVSLNLGELSQTETDDLVQTLMASETESPLTQFSQWLFAETDGQPLFLTETLKALVADEMIRSNVTTPSTGTEQAVWKIDWAKFEVPGATGPFGTLRVRPVLHGVQEVIERWLDRISSQAQGVLTAVAVLAQNATFDHLCHVAGLEEMQAIDALDELLDKQLLLETNQSTIAQPQSPSYAFYHQKVSEVVYAAASLAKRRMLHRRAFESLSSAAAPAADCAYHAHHAGLIDETIHYSLIAGNEALALFAVRVAITHFETVWQIGEQAGWPDSISGADRQSLYTALGRAYELTEAWPQAKATYEAMLAHAETADAPAMACLGLNHLATVYLNGLADRPQALAILAKAQQLAEQSGDRRGLAETEWNLSFAAIHAQNPKLALRHGERALAIAQELGHPHLLARCLTTVAQAYSFLRQWDKVIAPVLETHKLYTAAGDHVLAAGSQRGLGFSQLLSGNPTESLATLQETFAFSQQIENLMGEADCAWILARAHLECGNYGEAIKLGRQAVAQTEAVGNPLLHTIARSALGIIQRTVMDWTAAEQNLLDLFSEQSSGGEAIGWTDQAPELCALYAAVDDWERAYTYAKQITHHSHDGEPLLPFNLTGWCETEALLRGGDAELARAGVARLAKAVGNNKRYRLILLRSQAVLAQWEGEVAQAIVHLEAALALAQDIGLPGEAWPILAELGKLYAERGEQEKARAVNGEAAVIIHQLAGTIDDEALREGFVTAGTVQDIFENRGDLNR